MSCWIKQSLLSVINNNLIIDLNQKSNNSSRRKWFNCTIMLELKIRYRHLNGNAYSSDYALSLSLFWSMQHGLADQHFKTYEEIKKSWWMDWFEGRIFFLSWNLFKWWKIFWIKYNLMSLWNKCVFWSSKLIGHNIFKYFLIFLFRIIPSIFSHLLSNILYILIWMTLNIFLRCHKLYDILRLSLRWS